MATAGESKYEGGAGGKFRKRPFRRSQATPYDRPPTALRNPTIAGGHGGAGSSWFSKLITDGAQRLFASVFRKRLLPSPSSAQTSPDENQESRLTLPAAVSTNPPEQRDQAVEEGGHLTNSSSNLSGYFELEQILKQKSFTRSEIDRLTALLHSRTVDMPSVDEDKRSTENHLGLGSAAIINKREEVTLLENGFETHRQLGLVSTPVVHSKVVEDDIASPAELAKAYMGNRPSKVSPSMLGLRGQAIREDASLISDIPFRPKSPAMSLGPKSIRFGVNENGFMSPRSRGRSAIYNMARTPYSRLQPTSTIKGTGAAFDGNGGPSSSSSSQYAWDNGEPSASKHVALKRRISVLDNDIGSIGPIRRIRQKPNLLSPKNLTLRVSTSPLSVTSVEKPHSLIEQKHGLTKISTENGDKNISSTSLAPVPSQSAEMAEKILQQLDKLVPSPKDKSTTLREKSPSKLTPSMLHGQALRSLENIASPPKSLFNTLGYHKTDSTSEKQDKTKDDGPFKFAVPSDRLTPEMNGVNSLVSTNSAIGNSVHCPPAPKKRAFQMSAQEDYLDLDDDGYSNGDAPTSLIEGKEKLDTPLVPESKPSAPATEAKSSAPAPEAKPSAPVPESKPTASEPQSSPIIPEVNKRTVGPTTDSPAISENSSGFTFPISPAPTTTPVVLPQPALIVDNVSPPKETAAAPSLFCFGSKSDNQLPTFSFASSSFLTESSVPKFGGWSAPKQESSISAASSVGGSTETVPKFPESDKDNNQSNQKAGDLFRKPETSLPSALSTSTPTSATFSFGAYTKNLGLNNGSGPSSPFTFSSITPSLVSNSFTSESSSDTHSNTAPVAHSFDTPAISHLNTFSTDATIVTPTTTSAAPTSAATSSIEAASIFKFGSSLTPTSSVSAIESSVKEAKKEESGFTNLITTPFGATSSTTGNSSSSSFGFSASTTSSTPNNHSQTSGFTFGSGSSPTATAPPTGSPFQFGSSTSAPSPFTSGSSLFGSSTTSKMFSSGTTFSSSTFMANSVSSNTTGGTTNLFSFGSTISSTSSPSSGFSFGASSNSASSNNTAPIFGSPNTTSQAPNFSFAASTASSASQPIFGSTFSFGAAAVNSNNSNNNNNDQMNMEDSMAEDTMQGSPMPSGPVFGQPQVQPLASGFVFGSAAPSTPNPSPFQFGTQQQNPPFQASSSLDVNAGGSFSWGSGGGDKSNRKFVRVKQRQRKK